MKNFPQVKRIPVMLIFIMITNASTLLAQPGWELLPNSPHSDRFDDIYFVSDSVGVAVNSIGKIYKTTDAGDKLDRTTPGERLFPFC
jgi:hypothetical protein